MILSIDWSFKKPICCFNGTSIFNIKINQDNQQQSINELLKLSKDNGSRVIVENLPYIYQRYLLKSEIQVFNIHPNLVKNYTESNGIRKNKDYEEKSDEYDAKAIYNIYRNNPEYFFEAKLNPIIDELKDIMSEWNDTEELRISMTNRLLYRGEDPKYSDSVKILLELEKTYKKKVHKILKTIPIYNNFFKKISGAGLRISACFISGINIKKSHNVSSLIKYCGMGVTDGKADKLNRGQIAYFNPELKNMCFLLSEQFIIQRTPKYREIYDNAKERYKNSEKHKDKTLLHIERMSRRIAVKQFISDLYYHWRTLEGLTVEKPYVVTILGYKQYISPNPEKLEIINV